jgi:hypothetical protein
LNRGTAYCLKVPKMRLLRKVPNTMTAYRLLFGVFAMKEAARALRSL